MKNNLMFLMTVFLIASLTSCAQQKIAEKKVETEVKEVVVHQEESVAETAHDFIMNSDKLTDVQKRKLLSLQQKVHGENVSLMEEIDKTRLVLVETVLEPKMNEREYSILKKKIISLEKKRMDNGFKALTEARNIVDPKKSAENKVFYQSLFHNHLQEF